LFEKELVIASKNEHFTRKGCVFICKDGDFFKDSVFFTCKDSVIFFQKEMVIRLAKHVGLPV
jgi:hypothetical protein